MQAIRVQVMLCLCVLSIKKINAKTLLREYERKKNYIISEEANLAVGGDLELTEEEQNANEILMKLKHEELDTFYQHPNLFNYSKPFHKYKDQLKQSKIYQIIRRMPKGGALHLHSSLTLDADYFMRFTYKDFLYACYTKDDLQLQFSSVPPVRPCNGTWTLLSELRAEAENVEEFDENIKKFFMLYPEGKQYEDDDINTVWKRFEKIYNLMKALIIYEPHRATFVYDFLQKCYDENIMYVEVRSGLHRLQNLDGSYYDPMYMAKLYRQVVNNFKKTHPDFIGMKLIMSRNRQASFTEIREALYLANKLKNEVPEIFAGFDLVGQEDLGKPLSDFIAALIEAKDNGINFFFHAGETNWNGAPSDQNLVDAILLGSKRIGHGYALTKHPLLLSIIRKEDIAVEVNVISNVALSLLKDIRNHPLGTYLALGIPVVLSSDDPGMWGTDILSTDFYLAFIAIASREADLRLLKQLAINSIIYSALNATEKEDFMDKFNTRWNNFISEVRGMEFYYTKTEEPVKTFTKITRLRTRKRLSTKPVLSTTPTPITTTTSTTMKSTTTSTSTTTVNPVQKLRNTGLDILVNTTYLFDETEPEMGEDER